MTCFGVFDTIGSAVGGKISDKFGRKPIICFGVLTSLSGLFLSCFDACAGDVTAYNPCDIDSDGVPCDAGAVALFFVIAALNVQFLSLPLSFFSFLFFFIDSPSSSLHRVSLTEFTIPNLLLL